MNRSVINIDMDDTEMLKFFYNTLDETNAKFDIYLKRIKDLQTDNADKQEQIDELLSLQIKDQSLIETLKGNINKLSEVVEVLRNEMKSQMESNGNLVNQLNEEKDLRLKSVAELEKSKMEMDSEMQKLHQLHSLKVKEMEDTLKETHKAQLVWKDNMIGQIGNEKDQVIKELEEEKKKTKETESTLHKQNKEYYDRYQHYKGLNTKNCEKTKKLEESVRQLECDKIPKYLSIIENLNKENGLVQAKLNEMETTLNECKSKLYQNEKTTKRIEVENVELKDKYETEKKKRIELEEGKDEIFERYNNEISLNKTMIKKLEELGFNTEVLVNNINKAIAPNRVSSSSGGQNKPFESRNHYKSNNSFRNENRQSTPNNISKSNRNEVKSNSLEKRNSIIDAKRSENSFSRSSSSTAVPGLK